MEDDFSEFKLSDKIQAKLKNRAKLRQELSEGKPAYEVLGLSRETMHKFYNAAHTLLEHKRYQDAANAFLFLVTLNSYEHDYWMGLGIAAQLSQDFEAAIDAYEIAAICEVENPTPYFYLAKCLFAIHDRDAAIEALNLSIEYADDKEEFAQLKKEAKSAKKLLMKYK